MYRTCTKCNANVVVNMFSTHTLDCGKKYMCKFCDWTTPNYRSTYRHKNCEHLFTGQRKDNFKVIDIIEQRSSFEPIPLVILSTAVQDDSSIIEEISAHDDENMYQNVEFLESEVLIEDVIIIESGDRREFQSGVFNALNRLDNADSDF